MREVLRIDLVLKCIVLLQLIVDSKLFSTQNAQEEEDLSDLPQFYKKTKVWFWFAKFILKRSGSF